MKQARFGYFVFLGLFFILVNNTLEAKQFKFDHISVDDGLSENTVEVFYQDSRGMMWIGTRDGLNRYDGIDFTIFRFDRTDPNSLASSWITTLCEDMEENLWIGSLDGLNVYNMKTEKLSRVKVDSSDPDAFQGGKVHDIVIDKDGSVWLSTILGLVHYSSKKNTFKTYQSGSELKGTLIPNSLFGILITKSGRFFLSNNSQFIYEFDKETETFTEIQYTENQSDSYFKSLKEIEDDEIYITDLGSGFHILDLNTKESEAFRTDSNALTSLMLNDGFFKLNDSEVWLGTFGGGINIYHPSDKSFSYVSFDAKDPYSIRNNTIGHLFLDKDENIWVGTFGKGISLHRKQKEKFKSFLPNPFNPDAILSGVVTASLEDSQGRIWMGIDGGGLDLFDPESGNFKHYIPDPEDPTSLSSKVIICLGEDPAGRILIGTYQGGMMVFDPELEQQVDVLNNQNTLSGDHIWDIYKASDGKYYYAILGDGVDIYDPVDSSTTHLSRHNVDNRFFNAFVSYIIEGPEGRMWFASEKAGFAIYDFKNNTHEAYSMDLENINSLSNNNVSCIQFIDNYAWIATKGGGLNRFNPKDKTFKIYNIKNSGLASNALMGMLLDTDKNLWIGSGNGLIKFNTVTEEVTNYDKSQGLQGNEFRFNSQTILSDGTMIFGGSNGVTLFNPDSIKPSSVNPNIVFTDLKLNNKSATIDEKDSPLKAHINITESLVLQHKHRVFTLEFISLDYTAPHKNKYEYMLEGFDDEFIDAGNRRSVSFTNLNAGKYVFKLKGSNSDGIWSDTIRTINIKVLPPWYRTKLFILSVLLLITYLVIKYIRIREKQAKHGKEILETKIAENEKELQEKVHEIEQKKKEIEEKDQQEFEIRYLHQGISYFSDIITGNRKNIEELFSIAISELVRYVEANSGIIYMSDSTDPENIVLRTSGKYCFDSDLETKNEVAAGEGNIGTCFVEKKVMQMENLPEGYIVLRSSLGDTSLSNSVLIPLIHENNCMGVLEIASINKLPAFKIDLLNKLAENFASVLTISEANKKTQEMLEQNQMQAEELLAQEEEMRQNLEEMQATQEEQKRQMESSEKANTEMTLEQALVDALLNDTKDLIYFKDKDGKFIKASNSVAAKFKVKSVKELYGKSDFDFFSKKHAQVAYEDEKKIIKTGKSILNKIEKADNNDGESVYYSTSKLPLKDVNGTITGTIGISKDITEFTLLKEHIEKNEVQIADQIKKLKKVETELNQKKAFIKKLENKIKK